ncbi:MAG: diguanylate cyclase [Pseudomonadota bacterium]
MAGRILIVDANAEQRRHLKERLLDSFYLVDSLNAPEDPLLMARARHVDLVFIAIDGLNAGGYDAIARLRGAVRTFGIPIIAVISGPYIRGKAAHALVMGADDVIEGSLSEAEMQARVKVLIRMKRMQDELRLREDTARGLGLAPTKMPAACGRHSVLLLGCGERQPDRLTAQLTGCNGLDVTLVSESAEALESCRFDPGTLVLIRPDCTAAVAEGLQLIASLRSAPETRYTPVVMVVSPNHVGMALHGLDVGACDFVFDTVDIDELHARLIAHHRRFSLSDRLRADLTNGLEMAVTDPLTRLYNRRYAAAHMPRLMARSRAAGRPFTVMLLDIDNFKQVNDCHGHAVGDAVLVEAARRLTGAVRAVDLVTRFGGEEFLIALPDTSQTEAAKVAERVRREIAGEPMRGTGASGNALALNITVSVGLAEVGDGEQDAAFDTAFSRADHAMYRAKQRGRNCVSLFSAAA